MSILAAAAADINQPQYLLDTNIISHMMADADGAVGKRAQEILLNQPQRQLCTSIIVQCELVYGLAKRPSKRLQLAYEFQIGGLNVLPLDTQVTNHYAHLRAELERLGLPIGPNDTLIAAHALSIGAVLVTADSDFLRVPGLNVENWLADMS
jgi:tRNA(fMet)-specific endonuclease VapC